jgi:hypothetical protein
VHGLWIGAVAICAHSGPGRVTGGGASFPSGLSASVDLDTKIGTRTGQFPPQAPDGVFSVGQGASAHATLRRHGHGSVTMAWD